VIAVERVYKSFDQPVLRGCSLQVARGEIVGLVGPAAAGKSVLLRSLAGLTQLDAGSVVIMGQEVVGVTAAELRQVRTHIGMLFQNVALFDFMSVFENVAFPLRRTMRLAADEIAQRVHTELAAVGLGELAQRAPASLSGGQQRRVGLARAAVMRPPILLYDEPAAGLDPVSTARVFALIRAQRERLGASILVVSSDVDRVAQAVDRVAVMHQGRILFEGPPSLAQSSSHQLVRQFFGEHTHGAA